jgi:hypothetical protein
MRLLGLQILEETGNAQVSGNFPRRYYPDRVQRDSLSLATRFSVLVSRETRAEAPLFRRRSLKHKKETCRKRRKAGTGPQDRQPSLSFARRALWHNAAKAGFVGFAYTARVYVVHPAVALHQYGED